MVLIVSKRQIVTVISACGQPTNIRITYKSHTNHIRLTADLRLQKYCFFRTYARVGVFFQKIRIFRTAPLIRKREENGKTGEETGSMKWRRRGQKYTAYMPDNRHRRDANAQRSRRMTTRIACGTIDERRCALTEIARTGHRGVKRSREKFILFR